MARSAPTSPTIFHRRSSCPRIFHSRRFTVFQRLEAHRYSLKVSIVHHPPISSRILEPLMIKRRETCSNRVSRIFSIDISLEKINFYDYVSKYLRTWYWREKERGRDYVEKKRARRKEGNRMRYATRCEEFHFVLSSCSWDNVIMVNELANRI